MRCTLTGTGGSNPSFSASTLNRTFSYFAVRSSYPSVLMSPAERRCSAHRVTRATKSAIPAKTSAVSGIGGPQTSDERPAAVTSEIVQATRIGVDHLRHQKYVNTVNRLSNPHASCIIVSTCCQTVLERGNWRTPPTTAPHASTRRNSMMQTNRNRRTKSLVFIAYLLNT